MPTMKVKADEHGRIALGELCFVPLADIEALEVTSPNDAATGKAIKLSEARISVLGKVKQHDGKMANYTISLVVTREPVTDGEATACGSKLDAQKARKDAEEKREAEERQRAIKLVQDAERAAADRVMERDGKVLENTIRVLSKVNTGA